MKVLAVIPARMGSQRIARKNLEDIEPGISLVRQAVDCAQGLGGLIDQVVISTDEPQAFAGYGASVVTRPAAICGPTADIADAIKDAYIQCGGNYDFVVTLQPAVLARSTYILRHLLQRCIAANACGLTMARSVPWQWTIAHNHGTAPWFKNGTYPRSQDCPISCAEVNAIQISTQKAVEYSMRWHMPLIVAELPSWTTALDVDTPDDLATARSLWPWAKAELRHYPTPFHYLTAFTGGPCVL